MLGKDFRYEMKASSRFLLPATGACVLILLAFAAGRDIAAFMINQPESSTWYGLGQIADFLFTILGTLLFSAILFLYMGALAVRFYQSFSGPEAYTTFTLPVSTGTQLLGRLLVGAVYSLAAGVLTLCSAYFLFPLVFWEEMAADLSQNLFTHLSPVTVVLVVLAILLFLCCSLLMGYLQLCASIAIGGQFRSARIPISIAVYVVLNTVEGLIAMVLSAIPIGVYISSQGGFPAMLDQLNSLSEMEILKTTLQWSLGFAGLALLISLIFSVVHFFLCRWLYTKRLNLP